MGKTHFLRNLAIQADQQERWQVTFVNADRLEIGEPYSFIERLLAAGVAPDWNFEPATQLQPIAVARECVRRLLRQNHGPDEGHIIIIDDAHWIDPESIQVLRHMIPRFNRRNVFIACGARTPHKPGSLGELLAEAAATNPHHHHVEMRPLSEHDIRALAMQRFGVSISMRNAFQLSEITGGSFLGVDSILNQVTEEEVRQLHTTWDLPIRPRNLDNPLLGAYRELSPEAQQVVQIVCLAEHEITPQALQTVCRQLYIPAAIDEAVRAGVVIESDFGQAIVPKHHLIGAAVRETVEPAFGRKVHRLFVDLTEGFRSVRHMLKGAESWSDQLREQTAQYAREASQQSQYLNANDILRMALDLAQDPYERQGLITELVLINIRAKTGFKCLDLLPEIETFPPSTLREFLIVMLRVYLVNDPFPHRRIQDVLNTENTTPDEKTLQAFMVFMMVMMLMRSNDRSQISELIPVAKRLFAESPMHPEELADARLGWMVSPNEYILLLGCYAVALSHLDGDIDVTRQALPDLLDRTAELPDIAIKVDCLVPLAGAAVATGDIILAHDIAAQAVDILERVHGEPWTAATPRVILAHVLVLLGKYQQAEEVLDILDEFNHDALDLEARLTGAALRSSIAAIRCQRDPEQYLAHARRASDIDWEHYGRDLSVMAKVEIARVKDDAMGVVTAASVPRAASFRNTQRGFLTYKAHALITLGALDDARNLIQELRERRGTTWFEYWGTLDGLEARMAQAQDDHASARKLYESALKQRLFPLAWALTAIDYGEFLFSIEDAEGAENILREAVSTLEKIGATAYLRTAEQHLKKAIDRNSSAQTNAFAAMTKREREVAALLAEGHSNKTIAKQLVVSESTARFHVSNILRKLQLNSRAEVPRVLKHLTRSR
ncbi:hypothetical protein GCM10023190_16660 [Enteractinococcus fodinae]|uniref:DNA-binding CsgD family transcriptional regulator n=2 Tax=Enteractinococcus fodinae TaxID=684663 RepID=A0ABU2AWY1_9MICC|nr:DNA-binding CsgD family transcriptional regulator [Enteractinococcus fodinae]